MQALYEKNRNRKKTPYLLVNHLSQLVKDQLDAES